MNSEYLTKERMLQALKSLGEKLAQKNIQAHVYVVGGAVITFNYKSERISQDIDAIVSPEDEVFQAVNELTQELNLPEEWLNDTAKAFLPVVNLNIGKLILNRPGILVRTAPPEVILAMKVFSGRAKDIEDIELLAAILKLKTAQEIWDVFVGYYPSGKFLDARRKLINEIFHKSPKIISTVPELE